MQITLTVVQMFPPSLDFYVSFSSSGAVNARGTNKLLNKLAARKDRASLVDIEDMNMEESLPF